MGNTKGEGNRSVRESRRRLQEALVQLLIRKPVREITVRELTDLARVSRGTFYFHYGSIYELLDRIEQDQVDQINLLMDALLPRLDRQEVPAALQALFEYLDEHDAICSALLGTNGDPAFVQRLQKVIAARCTGYLAPAGDDPRQHYRTAFAVRGCFGIISRWLQAGKPESAAEMAAVTWQCIRATLPDGAVPAPAPAGPDERPPDAAMRQGEDRDGIF